MAPWFQLHHSIFKIRYSIISKLRLNRVKRQNHIFHTKTSFFWLGKGSEKDARRLHVQAIDKPIEKNSDGIVFFKKSLSHSLENGQQNKKFKINMVVNLRRFSALNKKQEESCELCNYFIFLKL